MRPARAPRRTASRVVAFLAVAVTAAGLTGTSEAGDAPSPLVLRLDPVTRTLVDGRTTIYAAPILQAVGTNVEVWSRRRHWDEGVVSEVRANGTTRRLPADRHAGLRELPDFFRLRVRDASGRSVYVQTRGVCLSNGAASRVTTDGPAQLRYPYECPKPRFATGSVQGVARGWQTVIPQGSGDPIALRSGTYQLTVAITGRWRRAIGISDADGIKTTTMRVLPEQTSPERRPTPARPTPTRPLPSRPATERSAPGVGLRPNLRALPAIHVRVVGGNRLSFEATTANYGPGPLVVEGTPAAGAETAAAFQAFYDSAGNLADRVAAGTWRWDGVHRLWLHAVTSRYQLLPGAGQDGAAVRRTERNPVCLDDIDPIDATVPGAEWRWESATPQTQCSLRDGSAIQEVLDAGVGDTGLAYNETAFDLRGLRNGTYRIAVTADPRNRLVETSDADNVSTRTVRIGGRPGHRTVKALPKGLVSG